MKKHIAKAWVKALRGGNLTQCRQVLSNSESEFCVLGVLCELYRARTDGALWVNTSWQEYGGNPRSMAKTCRAFIVGNDPKLNDDKHMPPLSVCDWAGLETEDVHSLSAANDRGETFMELAYAIEHMAGLA